jgi:Ca-activated chloride channel homolog
MKKTRFRLNFSISLGLSLLWVFTSCSIAPVNSFDQAYQYVQETIAPQIQVESALISDSVAQNRSTPPLAESLPALDSFPLYGAKPTNDPNIVYAEIGSGIL